MLLRSTLAFETRLSSFTPSIPRTASSFRPCLLPHPLRPRVLLAGLHLQSPQASPSSTFAGAHTREADDPSDGEPLQYPQERHTNHDSGLPRPEHSSYCFNRWKRSFKDLFHGTDEGRTRARHTMLRTEQRAAALRFASRRRPEQIHKCYMAMSENMIHDQLPDILAGCLLTGAGLTLRVLEALPPLTEDFTIRMDCLLMLRRDPKLWLEIEKSDGKRNTNTFYKQLDWQRDHGVLPEFALRQGHAALILEEASTLQQGSHFFEKYLATYSDRETSVLLKFVDFFTKREDSEQAVSALRRISPDDLRASDQRLLRRCTNLLKLDTIDVHGESKNFKILPQLLELGVKPDTFIHNMIIMNAIKAKVSRVGWDLYEYLKAENLETDAVTYLLLVKDAFARQDVSGLNEILSAIYGRRDIYTNPYLVGCTMNIIRIIYKYEKLANPRETFAHILSIHNRAWHPDIYISLNMIRPHEVTLSENLQLEKPPPRALAWTIFQYCLTQTQISVVDRLWSHITQSILISDPQILGAAAHESLYGGFIVFYGRDPRTLGKAVDIVQHMLDSPHCQPTGLTWMQLMCAYLRQGQQAEAAQIRRVMRRRGIEPKGKEFAYLLERWPDTEVARRARDAIAGVDDLEEDVDGGLFNEELFEGVPMAAHATGSSPTAWDAMLDLREQVRRTAEDEELQMMASLKASAASAVEVGSHNA